MSRCVFPVPESPIKHTGWPAFTQAQVASCPITAGLIAGLASKENSSSRLGRGKPASRMRRSGLFELGGARHGFGVRSGGPVALDTGCASEQLVEEPRAYGGRYDDSVRAARCRGRCVERHRDGRVAHVVTVDESAAACPGCGVFSTSVKQYRVTRPRDLGYGEEPLAVRWHKRQFRCRERGCSRRAFTESIAELPPGARVTGRLRRAAGAEVDEHGSVRAAAAGHGISWPVVHAAFVGHADAQLVEPAPVAVLGIDATRRGRPRWDRDPDSGRWRRLDRFETNFVDLGGDGGLLGQTGGRTAAAVVAWLDARGEDWKAAVRSVAMDPCATYRRAVQDALPQARIVADHFHLVRLANDAVTRTRQRVTRDRLGRRGRRTDPAWAN